MLVLEKPGAKREEGREREIKCFHLSTLMSNVSLWDSNFLSVEGLNFPPVSCVCVGEDRHLLCLLLYLVVVDSIPSPNRLTCY